MAIIFIFFPHRVQISESISYIFYMSRAQDLLFSESILPNIYDNAFQLPGDFFFVFKCISDVIAIFIYITLTLNLLLLLIVINLALFYIILLIQNSFADYIVLTDGAIISAVYAGIIIITNNKILSCIKNISY